MAHWPCGTCHRMVTIIGMTPVPHDHVCDRLMIMHTMCNPRCGQRRTEGAAGCLHKKAPMRLRATTRRARANAQASWCVSASMIQGSRGACADPETRLPPEFWILAARGGRGGGTGRTAQQQRARHQRHPAHLRTHTATHVAARACRAHGMLLVLRKMAAMTSRESPCGYSRRWSRL